MPLPVLLSGFLLGGAWLFTLVPPSRAEASSIQGRGVRAVFATQAEAEAAAPRFGCKGAHRMGKQWMPCATHGEASGDAQAMPHH